MSLESSPTYSNTHSTLVRKFVNYGQKSFKTFGPRSLISNGRNPKSSLGQVYNPRLGCFVVIAWRVHVIHTASSTDETAAQVSSCCTNVCLCCHRNQQSNLLNSQTYTYYKRSLVVTNKMNLWLKNIYKRLTVTICKRQRENELN